MSVSFTKLFSSITESTVWCESDRTRLVWITMLAMADRKGRVWASIPGLANRARVPVEDCAAAIETFLRPDHYSRTKTTECEGRRIEPIDGGWRLINYAKYRAIKDEQNILESKRNYINSRRNAERECRTNTSTVEPSRTPYTQAEAEAEAEVLDTSSQEVRGEVITTGKHSRSGGEVTGKQRGSNEEKPSARKRASRLPDGFGVSPSVRQWAEAEGYAQHLDAHLAYFVDFAEANGKTYADWDSAFRNCIRADWGDVRRKAAATPATGQAAIDEFLRRGANAS